MKFKLDNHVLIILLIIVVSILIAYLLLNKTRKESFRAYNCNYKNPSDKISEDLYKHQRQRARPLFTESNKNDSDNLSNYISKERFNELENIKCKSC